MIGVYNHLHSKVFRFHYHSQEVIGSLGIYRNFHGSILDAFEQCTCPQWTIHSTKNPWFIFIDLYIAIFHVCFFGVAFNKKTNNILILPWIIYIYIYIHNIYIYMMYLKKQNGELAATTSNHLNETQTRHRVVTKSESPESTAQATAPRPSCGQGKLYSEPILINFFRGG